jgi:hypothetical protein
MIRRAFLAIVLTTFLAALSYAQAPAPPPAAAVWNALSAPAMDPAKSARTDNVEIVRDRVHITLLDGTIQFVQAVNGVTFGAAFHGKGRVRMEPPNPWGPSTSRTPANRLTSPCPEKSIASPSTTTKIFWLT